MRFHNVWLPNEMPLAFFENLAIETDSELDSGIDTSCINTVAVFSGAVSNQSILGLIVSTLRIKCPIVECKCYEAS